MYNGNPDNHRRQNLYHTRRLFVCTECHRQFRNTADLYQHVELCLLEAFESEALSIISDMPIVKLPQHVPSSTPFGIVAKPTGLPAMEGRVEVRLGMPISDKDQPHVFLPSTSKEEYLEENEDTEQGPSSSRMIEGPGGLRLVVTVEKEDLRGDIDVDLDKDNGMSILEMQDGDYMDEDLAGIQEEEEEINNDTISQPLVTYNRRQVIGALANAEDEPYKPKMECPTCGLVLYRHNFATHYRIHTGELPFPCQYCEKRFRSSSALKVHTRAHTGEKPYECPSCDYAALTKRNLDRHILNNHVRAGERRGPRFRKSKYRMDSEDTLSAWNLLDRPDVDQSTSVTNRSVYDARKDHQYEGLEEEEEIVEYGDDDEMGMEEVLEEADDQ